MKNRLVDIILIFGTLFLFLFSSIIPSIIGNTIDNKIDDDILEKITHACYGKNILLDSKEYKDLLQNKRFDVIESDEITTLGKSIQTELSDGPMDSSWPMKCHDTHHTGRSPYSTANILGEEKWKFWTDHWIEGGIAIDNNGTLYFGGSYEGLPWYLYAIYPNGTFKWRFKTNGLTIFTCPAIGSNGTIYFGSWDHGFYALYPNGSQKWRFGANSVISSSPAIGRNGTIYFGDGDRRLYALNPDGTEKWHFDTSADIWGDPAIGDDGTIYIGSWDNNFYALYPNGTLRWQFPTGNHIKGPPSIADDGTIYIGSWDDYLYAIYPNGTMKWRCVVGSGTETNPSIANDGTIYVGGDELYAVYPNGTIKWVFDLGPDRHIHKSSPAISAEGIVYVGTHIGDYHGGEIIAVNSDGTERWRKRIGEEHVQSSPTIDKDGTVYIGSSSVDSSNTWGYIHAFGIGEFEADANGPYISVVDEPVQFTGSASGGYPPYSYLWDFGDEGTSVSQNPTHEYENSGNYTVTLTVTDDNDSVAIDTTWALIRESNEPPEIPTIDGETEGNYGEPYDYTFISNDLDGDDVWYHIHWGDDTFEEWFGPYASGEEVVVSHTWEEEGTYTIKAKAKDIFEAESDWGYLEVTMPVNQPVSYPLLELFRERFPLLYQLFIRVLEVNHFDR